MFDDFLRLGFLTLIGLALLLITAFYLNFLYGEFAGAGETVIDPFTVVPEDGKEDADRGKALAQALQARLQTLASELREAGRALTEPKSTGGPGPGGAVPPSIVPGGMTGALIPTSNPLISPRLEALKTGLFESIDLKLSVGGLDVGGVMPWLQRQFFRRRTVHFTVFAQKGAAGKSVAKVFGSVAALGVSSGALELEVEGEDASGPSPAKIADRLAYEIIRLYLAEDKTNQFRFMEPSDFSRFAAVFIDIARAQRQPLLPAARTIFEKTAPDIEQIADRATLWPELNYFAAWVADNTNDTDNALLYYQRAQVLFANGGKADPARQIESRIADLNRTLAATASIEAAGTFPPSLDYSSDIRIRDGGPEGSVVGQALATVLEFQILKATHQPEEISARWIYYAARKSEGTVSTDSGALIKDGISALQDPGAVAESVWPYKPGEFSNPPPQGVAAAKRFRIRDARQITTLAEIKEALIDNGPVVIGIAVFQSLMAAKTGVVPMPSKNEPVIGGHAVAIVGYDDAKQRVMFANSWGRGWGDNGFGYLPYAYLANPKLTSEAWTFKLRQ